MAFVQIVTILFMIDYLIYALAAQYFFVATDSRARNVKLYITVAGPLAVVTVLYAQFSATDVPAIASLAALLFIISSMIIFLSSLSQNKWKRMRFGGSNIAPTRLLETGPYAWVRHPIYVAYILGWCGGALNSLNPLAFLMGAIMTSIYVWAAKLEEDTILTSELRKQYLKYMQVTKRFIPYVV
jgi:protein-S-isoprenylcysteine O-methyltransferase Ste14